MSRSDCAVAGEVCEWLVRKRQHAFESRHGNTRLLLSVVVVVVLLPPFISPRVSATIYE